MPGTMDSPGQVSEEAKPELPEVPDQPAVEAATTESGLDMPDAVFEKDGDDVASIKTTTTDILSENGDNSSPNPEAYKHKLGLDINYPNGWSGSNYDDYDVIAVHGIRDDYRTAWTNKNGKWWVKTDLFSGLSVREIDYSFEIQNDSTIYGQGGIRLHAEILLEKYVKIRGELEDTEIDRPVIWLCHDLGGTIVKEALSIAIRNPSKYGKISILTTSIIFLETPHRFQSREDLEDQLHQLILLPGPKITKVPSKVQNLATQVDRINQDFVTTKLLDRAAIFNYFTHNQRDSLRVKPADYYSVLSEIKELTSYPDPVTPFPRYAHSIGHSFEATGRLRANKFDHLDLVRDDEWIKEFPKIFNTIGFPVKVYYQILEFQARLLSLAPPTRALDTPFDPVVGVSPMLKWVSQQKPWQGFVKRGNSHKIVHVHKNGDPSIDIIDAFRTLYLSYDSDITSTNIEAPREAKKSSLYFEFDQRDSRYNTLSSMLLYFINAITWKFVQNCEYLMLEELEFLNNTSAWSLEDLYFLFTTLRYGVKATYEVNFFIGNFDQCPKEEQEFFLNNIMERQSYTESGPKIIISTSSCDSLAVEELLTESCINLTDFPAAVENGQRLAEQVTSSVDALVVKRPIYKEFRSQLDSLLKECSEQPRLSQIVLEWLEKYGRGKPKSDIDSIFGQLGPITPEGFVNLWIKSLPATDQPKACNIFNWIKHAAEPFSPESLAEAVFVNDFRLDNPRLNDLDTDEFISELQKIFGGIIIIENRDIKFSLPEFYDVPEIGVEGNPEERAANINNVLAEICLLYFHLEDAQVSLRKFFPEQFEGGPWQQSVDAVVISYPRTSLAEYAVRFWPQHYKVSGQFKPSELVHKLFQNKNARAAWEIPFWLFSNPFTRRQQSYPSTLPIVAMLGLKDLVDEEIKSKSGQASFGEICWLAISEAARAGNESIALQILEHVDVDTSGLQDALFWAAATRKATLINALLGKIPKLEAFQWPEHLLYRAIAAELKDLVVAMLLSGLDINQTGTYWKASPSTVAVWWNSIPMMETLLSSEPKPDLTVEDEDGDTPITSAAQRGNPRMIKLLLNSGASVEVEGSGRLGLVQIAIQYCNHQATKVLIESGAPFKTGLNDPDSNFFWRSPILVASDKGFTECVRILLDHGADPNTECEMGTALYKAVLHNHLEVVQLLLDREPRPDMSVIPANSPLLITHAVLTRNTELVSLLIRHGAEMDVVDTTGSFAKTPISRAILDDNLEMVKLFLENKADVNYTGGVVPSDPPLFTSLYENRLHITDFLLEREDVDLFWKASDGMGTLHVAVRYERHVPEILKRGVPIDSNSIHGTPLHLCAMHNYIGSLKHLLAHDPKPDLEYVIGDDASVVSQIGYTALHIACKNLSFDAIKLLLEAGANPASKAPNGQDAVDILLFHGSDSTDAVEYLRLMLAGKNGVSVNEVDEHSRTRLHRIKHNTSVAIVRYLVEARVPLDIQDRDGYTPLAVAIKEGNEDVARYLLKEGASIKVYSSNFGSILHLAVASGFVDLVKSLIDLGADPNDVDAQFGESVLYTALSIESKPKLTKMLRYLVDEIKIPVDKLGGKFAYPIIRAANITIFDHILGTKCLKFLIRRGAQLNVTDDQGRRALHHACASWYDGGIECLIKAGAEIDAKDKMGRLPIHFAAATKFQDTLVYLLDKFEDMDVNVVDQDNWTPLMWAARSGDDRSIPKLVTRKADVWAKGRGYDVEDEWSALKLANFADRDEDVKDELVPKERTRVNDHGKEEEWNEYFHKSRAGGDKKARCASCLVMIVGIQWKCLECTDDFSLCFKCYSRRSDIHNIEHSFEEIGPLYAESSSSPSPNHSNGSDAEDEVPQGTVDERSDGDGLPYNDDTQEGRGVDEDEFNLDDVDFDADS